MNLELEPSAPRIVAFIPLRGGSKSIPMKNIKPLAGKPLAFWTIKAAVDCPAISTVYVSTDSGQIKEVVEGFGFKKVIVIGRKSETASDTASSESALLDFAKEFPFESMVFIQATSPLLKSSDLSAAISHWKVIGADSLLSVVRQKRFLWEETQGAFARPLNYSPTHRPRRQDFEGFIVENGAFYITTREALLKTGCRISGHIGFFEMQPESYIELDESTDWKILESLLSDEVNEGFKKWDFSGIRMLVSDVDGVLTDAGMYYSEAGDELKKFNTRDAVGLRLLQATGMTVGIITSENTRLVERRAAKMGMDFVRQGVVDKLAALLEECASRNISLSEVVYIGDDINDLDCIQKCGIGICPVDAAEVVKKHARMISIRRGGEGVVREVADRILQFQAGQRK
jgi:N-acylneuraminate cytidylyltransferase